MKQTLRSKKAVRRERPIAEPDEEKLLFERVKLVARAAEEKKAQDLLVLRLAEITTFTDYFIICSGTSSRQVQAIADEIMGQLRKGGVRPLSTEGYANAEWILLDYGSFIVHVFSDNARRFYDLERLWSDAERIEIEAEDPQS
jgi:ribosome-associated protein